MIKHTPGPWRWIEIRLNECAQMMRTGKSSIPRSGKYRREWIYCLVGKPSYTESDAPDGGKIPDAYDHPVMSLRWDHMRRGQTSFCGGPKDADRHLIAAAPELLEALIECRDHLYVFEDMGRCRELANAALSKAGFRDV